MPIQFSKQLLNWYEKYGRHNLPWQKNPTPYRVWISEIMLQQTQVTTVIPYYQRFMQDFPTVKALALATEDDVLSHWSGLGYYARARNIYKTANLIHTQYRGRFPTTVETLSELPGIGKSTAGAIISFSMQKKAVILDGNVKRVLARYHAIKEPINKKNTIDKMWLLAEKFTPKENASHYNQAMMDLGATLCTRSKPRCTDCPFTKNCKAHQENQSAFYPVKTSKKERPTKKVRMLIISNPLQEILLLKRPSSGIWGGLWGFPEYTLEDDYTLFQTLKLKYLDELEKITHQFTHFRLEIFPMLLSLSVNNARKLEAPHSTWYQLGTPLPGGVATPVSKILTTLSKELL
ncbi:MAG: A/G-specific adenine glycosylase [Gammaproteobacteria bacterium CG_4_10_14_0_8_um_filter_38_16]|nr:MAG: A/G-specific adenine glycosylase [Gammaproteobacteria bacterium CG_4_10_14_0_8_um_filter_38_16]PJA03083.1 MAG: A/G-specific adenine glycosylase [Gammaproteobacteria bacterium CG_4_10_14_0_2_um_filter_38_22]